MNPPHRLVSVVVRSMDRPTLDRALQSVAAQAYPAIEVIVVDAKGAHRDLPPTCGPFPMRLVRRGQPLDRSRAANAGLEEVRGDFICFLDDDDWFEPQHIGLLAHALAAQREPHAAYAGVRCVLPDEKEPGGWREVLRYNAAFDHARLLCENYLPVHSVLFARASAQRTKGFDPAFGIFEDWDFWLQLAEQGPFQHVDALTAVYRLGSGDSGLYGNTALQEETAARVLHKWVPRWDRDELVALWRLGRKSLQAHGRLAATAAGRQREVTEWQQQAARLQQSAADAQREAAVAQHRSAEAQLALRNAQEELASAQRESGDAQRKLGVAQSSIEALQHHLSVAQQNAGLAQQQLAQAQARLERDLAAAEAQRVQQLADAEAQRALQAAAAAYEASVRDERIRQLESSLAVSEESARRLRQSLEIAMKEYEQAMTLLRREQLSVLKPIARHVKAAAKPVFHRLPQPLQQLARRIARRPLHVPQPAVSFAPVVPAPAAAAEPVEGQAPVVDVAQQWRNALAGGAEGAPTVLVFPVIDWHFRVQRPQHLARELARRGHRVLYLTTTFQQGSGPDACRLLGSPAANVHLLQLALPGTPPNIYEDVLTPDQCAVLCDTLTWLQREARLGAFISMVNLPFWRPVASSLPANLMVYDCMDFHAGFSSNTGRMLDEEHRLLQDCDLLLTSSLRLSELMQEKAAGKPHALVRNGTEVEHFASAPQQLKLQPDGRPVVGYFGAISEWFDIALVTECARSRPDWRFVLVGSTYGCDVSEAQKLPNIEFTGEVPYAELPGWVHAFDVCLIPFLINELTSCTNPVKVYEYLSAGKPVVATRMPELEAIADQVAIADDAPGFVRAIEKALHEGDTGTLPEARREWARQHSWAARADLLEHALRDALPTVSVVVLCYNNLALTQACLESVERHSHWPKLELVIVDNASSDGTPDWLREWASGRPWVKLVLNSNNLGFAAGNNVGLEAATGDVLIMLNNDTQVSPGWIHGLWRHLAHDRSLGMVGPVTNNIGNEAKIDVGYETPGDMVPWAMQRAVRHAGRQTSCRVLAFFCVAMRREVYEQVGGLDEAFGLGFFEDDDYCNRARASGWQMAIADDVFVHHHLSASFDKLKASARQALFEKNKAIYEAKWGPWVPHRYRQAETQE